jgi:hypothetical protein
MQARHAAREARERDRNGVDHASESGLNETVESVERGERATARGLCPEDLEPTPQRPIGDAPAAPRSNVSAYRPSIGEGGLAYGDVL